MGPPALTHKKSTMKKWEYNRCLTIYVTIFKLGEINYGPTSKKNTQQLSLCSVSLSSLK